MHQILTHGLMIVHPKRITFRLRKLEKSRRLDKLASCGNRCHQPGSILTCRLMRSTSTYRHLHSFMVKKDFVFSQHKRVCHICWSRQGTLKGTRLDPPAQTWLACLCLRENKKMAVALFCKPVHVALLNSREGRGGPTTKRRRAMRWAYRLGVEV